MGVFGQSIKRSNGKVELANNLITVMREAGWTTNGIIFRMTESPLGEGKVTVWPRQTDDPKIDLAAKAFLNTLNGDCIDTGVSPPFKDNGEFGQIIIVDEKGRHIADDQKIARTEPIKNVDISLLVGDAR